MAMSMMGSPDSMANSSRSALAFSTGSIVAMIRLSASRIRPTPMATRPRSRVRVLPPLLKAMSPTSTKTGAIAATLKVSTCTISVVPTLAPSVTASAGTSVMKPPAMKLVHIKAVAVLLCRRAVMPRPARNAFQRLFRPTASACRRWPPKARTMPVCTMCMPHSSNATISGEVQQDQSCRHFCASRSAWGLRAVDASDLYYIAPAAVPADNLISKHATEHGFVAHGAQGGRRSPPRTSCAASSARTWTLAGGSINFSSEKADTVHDGGERHRRTSSSSSACRCRTCIPPSCRCSCSRPASSSSKSGRPDSDVPVAHRLRAAQVRAGRGRGADATTRTWTSCSASSRPSAPSWRSPPTTA